MSVSPPTMAVSIVLVCPGRVASRAMCEGVSLTALGARSLEKISSMAACAFFCGRMRICPPKQRGAKIEVSVRSNTAEVNSGMAGARTENFASGQIDVMGDALLRDGHALGLSGAARGVDEVGRMLRPQRRGAIGVGRSRCSEAGQIGRNLGGHPAANRGRASPLAASRTEQNSSESSWAVRLRAG